MAAWVTARASGALAKRARGFAMIRVQKRAHGRVYHARIDQDARPRGGCSCSRRSSCCAWERKKRRDGPHLRTGCTHERGAGGRICTSVASACMGDAEGCGAVGSCTSGVAFCVRERAARPPRRGVARSSSSEHVAPGERAMEGSGKARTDLPMAEPFRWCVRCSTDGRRGIDEGGGGEK